MGPLVSPRGNSAVAEYVDNEFEVIGRNGDYQAATNFLLSEKKFNFGNGRRNLILETDRTVMRNCTDLTASVITGRQYDKPAHEFRLI